MSQTNFVFTSKGKVPDLSDRRMGMHSFAIAAPTEWNKLCQAIRTQDSINEFRQQLKTYLFRLAFPPL